MLRVLVFALLAVSVPASAQWIDDCGLVPPGSMPLMPVRPKAWEPQLTSADAPVVSRIIGTSPGFGGFPTANVAATGALTGKTIYLSPGHGFTWTSLGAAFEWRTQRPATNAIVEDLVSTETLNQYLIPMLLNAGARVVSVREADLNPNLVIVDNGEPGYLEQGSAAFLDSVLKGWGRSPLPMSGDVQPFTVGSNRLMSAAATITGTVGYTAAIPEDGYYNVSVSYSAFSTRVTDAHYAVHHAGGTSHFRVNQQRHGGTWELLGRFYFHAGPAKVEVFNDSASGTGYISLDAVKLGGGVGQIARDGTGTATSGRPRFEESARYHAQFAGAPPAVFAPTDNTPGADRTNDIRTRSRFAAWVHEPGEDAVYVAWHTNAFDGTALGTNTFVYGPSTGGAYDFTGVDGGDVLAKLVHAELVSDIRSDAGWNQPAWKDRGVDSANFGELDPAENPETPAILIEVAFHDNASDATQLKEPDFRYLATRAITQGIIKYFAQKDQVPVRLPPEPPGRISVVSQGAGLALLRWTAGATDSQNVRGDAAASFRVYSSGDGLGWDDGVSVTGTAATVSVPGSAPRYFRVTGVNAGGESFPSSVVGVKAPIAGRPRVLVVDGYDRLEAAIAPYETFAARYALGTVERVLILQMNDGASVRLHGDALDAYQAGFDSEDADAFADGAISSGPSAVIDWLAGRGRAQGAGPSSAMQNLLQLYRASRPVLFSGNANAASSFVASVFSGATSSVPGSRLVNGAGPLGGLSNLGLSDGFQGSYAVGLPPSVDPLTPAISLGAYDTGGNAGVGVPAHVAYLAFSLEGVTDPSQRAEVLRRLLDFLLAVDAGVGDAGFAADAGQASDAGSPDAGALDAGVLDAGLFADAGRADAGSARVDAGEPDAGPGGAKPASGCGCQSAPGLLGPGALLLALWRGRRSCMLSIVAGRRASE